jgi:hypothetical protein
VLALRDTPNSERRPGAPWFAHDSPLEESGFEPSVPLLRKGLPGLPNDAETNQLGPVMSSGPLTLRI